jgi:endonuclease I
MRSDIHHLFPTHMDANAARGSDPFGEIDDATTENWFGVAGTQFKNLSTMPSSNRDTHAEDTVREFEPPEAHEGDLARAIFYFYTMYPKGARSIDDIAADGVGQFFTWHLQDPPDAKEIERNGRIESVQGNRNPYVDRPELVCRAYELPCGGS